MERIIHFPERILRYQYEIKDVKNINVRVRPDMTVYVSANKSVESKDIDAFLMEKRKYILSALEKYEEVKRYSDIKKEFVDGESYRYLGRDLRLKLKYGEPHVETDGLFLYLTVRDNSETEKKNLIENWYNTQCKNEVCEVCDNIYAIFKKYGVAKPQIIFKNMVSRWGSCQPKRGSITLNRRLIEMPRICIEYVVLHEFVHFLQADHSKQFYAYMTMFMPDWEQRARLLEKEGVYGITY